MLFATGQEFGICSPWDGSEIARIKKSTKQDVDLVIDSISISKDKIYERLDKLIRLAHLLKEKKQEFIQLLVMESGKTEKLAESEVNASIDRLLLAQTEAGVLNPKIINGDLNHHYKNQYAIIKREPVGRILLIIPFNYPLFTLVAKLTPALLAGNAVIIKPSTKTPLSAIKFMDLISKVGFDKQVAIVIGSSDIGDYLVSHKRIDMISFTGSTAVGERIVSLAGIKKLQLELGGKGSAIILDDADLHLAAKEVALGAFKYMGQRCDAIGRVFIPKHLLNNFLTTLKEEMSKIEPNPLISKQALDRLHLLVDDASKKGTDILEFGEEKGLIPKRYLVLNANESMKITFEEVFGPALPILTYDNLTNVFEIINKTPYALDSCIFTRNIEKAVNFQLPDGSIHINKHPTHGLGLFPFGGNKKSGIGREGIGYSIKEMTNIKTIVVKKRNLYNS